MEETISRITVPQWALKWQWHLPMSLCPRMNQKLSVIVRLIDLKPLSGEDSMTTSFPCGIQEANRHRPTITFTAKISETETTFNFFKGERFKPLSIFDIRTHFKPTDIPIHAFLFLLRSRREKGIY